MSATNRGSKRAAYDFYATPEWCVHTLLQRYNISNCKRILEPCSGNNDIAKVIFDYIDNETNVITNDIRIDSKAEYHYDYLNEHCKFTDIDLIITNPPYSLASEFIYKSLEVAPIVIMLLRLNFLGSKKRLPLWKEQKLQQVIVLHKRPSFINGATDATEYAWFIFNEFHSGQALLSVA